MEPLLFLVTLGLEYLIWGLITFAHGQTPGKQVLGMRVVRLNDGHAVGFGLSLVREVIAKPVIGVLSLVTFGIVNFWLLWDKDKQELWDKVVGTIVVNDRRGLTLR
ncbi:MAG: RDD family protein [Candidatus Binataceae bacterium]